MSFWNLDDGDSAATGTSEYEIEGGNLTPIPDDSSVIAMIDEAKWADKDGSEYISLRWTVLNPDEYKNRKVFQKLWVTDDDPGAKDAAKAAQKRDKAKRMLAAIDKNAGGKLSAKAAKPTDQDLTAHLTNKPMVIKLKVWSMPDRENPGATIDGNWICGVSSKEKGIDVKAAVTKTRPAPVPSTVDDSEIPF